MTDRDRFLILLNKYATDNITPEERSEFLEGVTSGIYDELILQHYEDNLKRNQGAETEGGISPHRSADIVHKILSSEKQNTVLILKSSRRKKVVRWLAAACVIGLAGLLTYSFNDLLFKNEKPNISFGVKLKQQSNSSAYPMEIKLEDGSLVTLQPGSSIHYPAHFLAQKREVFLEGEAFFDVTKRQGQPFFVFNKNVVTHVLGTSFNVKLNALTQEVEVSVRSGKVEVYENSAIEKNTGKKKDNGVILLPNQKVVYHPETRVFVPSLVDVPLPLLQDLNASNKPTEKFEFEKARLEQVLQLLERNYGVEIVTEREAIYNCLFTGDLSRELDLYARLTIICQSVAATYEIKGTRILIKGNGCL